MYTELKYTLFVSDGGNWAMSIAKVIKMKQEIR